MNTQTSFTESHSPKNTRQLVAEIKAAGEDFEWYPTTCAMIDVIKQDMQAHFMDNPSVLDCGAGDGRVLMRLTNGKRYAIEKSMPLLHAMDKDIFIVGTEFDEQTLIDKNVSVIFSNPPYSCYEQWVCKIITEANAGAIYCIIPSRWQQSQAIQAALDIRDATASIIDECDFTHAERQARAKVNIVRIDTRRSHNRHNKRLTKDPFDVWFDQHFSLSIEPSERSSYGEEQSQRESIQAHARQALVKGRDIGEVLVTLYNRDLTTLLKTYKKLEGVNAALLKELNVNIKAVKEALQQKIEGLKDLYWHELFNHFDKITERLTTDTRQRMLATLTDHTHIDFTRLNIYAIATWVIKNANEYFNDQLISMVERMTEKASIVNYVSNKKTFGDECWRYHRTPETLSHYKLDYRIVLERIGGLSTRGYWSSRTENGLSESASHFIDDLCVIASNIGFDTKGYSRSSAYLWESRHYQTFLYCDHTQGIPNILFEVAAFKNGNLHFKFNQAFIMQLNVEFGRLKGWLKSSQEAATELAIPPETAAQYFGGNCQLGHESLPMSLPHHLITHDNTEVTP